MAQRIIEDPKNFWGTGDWISKDYDFGTDLLLNISEEWGSTEEAQACIFYMKSGVSEGRRYWKKAAAISCLFSCSKHSHLGLDAYITPDSKYCFPENFWHYIEIHNVKIPNPEFLQDAMEYYQEHKNEGWFSRKCNLCKKEFQYQLIDSNNFCSKECSSVAKAIRTFDRNTSYRTTNLQEEKEYAAIIMNSDLSCIDPKVKEKAYDVFNSIYQCKKCNAFTLNTNSICKSTDCQLLYKYDSLPDCSIVDIVEDEDLPNEVADRLLKERFNCHLYQIQKVINAKTNITTYKINLNIQPDQEASDIHNPLIREE